MKLPLAIIASITAILAADCAETLGFGDIAGKGRLEVPENAPCCVTGVVTYTAAWLGNSGIVASPDDINGFGIWFSGEVNGVVVKLENAENLNVGDLVEVTGTTSRLGFAPGIKAERIVFLNHEGREIHESPPVYRLRDFDWGVLDNRRATICGVLMSARTNSIPGYSSLQVATADGDFLAHVPGDAAKWQKKTDAEIAVSGIALSLFNIRGEFIGVQMDAIRPDGVRIVKEAVGFESVPETHLADILPYSGKSPDSHRRKVHGTVTYANDSTGMVYLQSDTGALRVETSATGLNPGDKVVAVGFPKIESGMGLLAFAEIRKLGEGMPPAPLDIEERQLKFYPINDDGTYGNLDAKLVRLEGRLLTVDEKNVVIDVNGMRVAVSLSAPLGAEILDTAQFHPTLRLTGVLSILQDPSLPDGRVPSIAGWRLEAAGGNGVEIVGDEAWLQYKESLRARIAFLCALGLAALIAIFFTNRYVRFRAEYKQMDILAKERKRMAADLHDTIEQNLLAAKLLLQTSVSMSPDTPGSVKDAIESAGEILMSAKKEIRETIFNLRSDELFSRNCADVLKTVAKRITALGVAKVRTNLRGLPARLPGAMFSDIIHIIKEAATNAVKHGGAKNILIVTDPCDGGFSLRVANDGAPFDPDTAPGALEGHFGLTGMHERSKRNNIGFSLYREKSLTVVKLEVRL